MALTTQNQDIVYRIDAQDNNLNADYWDYWLEYYSPRYQVLVLQINQVKQD